MASEFALSLLGDFALRRSGSDVALQPQSRRVIAFVALQDRPVARAKVSGLLWPLRGEDRAGAALRSAIWHIERRATGLLQTTRNALSIDVDVRVDVAELRSEAFHAFRGGAFVRHPSLLEVDLLPDWDEDWLYFERERMRQRRIRVLERLCRAHTESGSYELAIDAGLLAVSAEPLRESAHRALIEAHLAEGNVGEARRQYKRFADLISSELGASPSVELERIALGQP